VLPPAAEGEAPSAPAVMASHALWIAAELLARDRRDATPPTRAGYHLYEGRLGPALFHAALAATTGSQASLDAAHGVVEALAGALAAPPPPGAAEPIGICSGTGSLVYALTCIARLIEYDRAADLAAQAAATIDAGRVRDDAHFDVASGSAGAILALLALHAYAGDPRLVETAAACGERLLEASVDVEGASAWRAPDGRLYTGFAHGAAGIGLALVRLFRATGREEFLRAAARAHAFERRLFVARHGNWPMAGGPHEADRGMMTAWCHGAPGIALARLLAAKALGDRALLGGVAAALRATAAVPVRLDDHLCCGSLGRADVLLTAGERLGVAGAAEAARRIGAQVMGRAAAEGRYRLSSRGPEFRVFDPGFFRGLSGIGYQLLRLAAPARLPSVLAFELPPASARRQ
jgi:lantibiotic modifying enzyme